MTDDWRERAMVTWRRAADGVPGSVESARLSLDALRILAVGVAECGALDDVAAVELMADRAVAAVTLAVAWRALTGGDGLAPPPVAGPGEAAVLREARAVVEGTDGDGLAS